MWTRPRVVIACIALAVVAGVGWFVLGREGASVRQGAAVDTDAPAEGAPADGVPASVAPAGRAPVALASAGTGAAAAPRTADSGPRWNAWIRVGTGFPWSPVADADVRLVDEAGAEHLARTDASGLVSFRGLPGTTARVRARATGFTASDEGRLEPGRATEKAPFSVRLAEAESVAGAVVDARTGRGIAGARVSALLAGAVCMNPVPPQRIEREETEATTDAAGAFRLDGVTKEDFCALRVIRVEAAGFRTQWHVPRVQTGPGPVTIRLVEGGRIEGVVMDPNGAPHRGATILAVLGTESRGGPAGWASGFQPPEEYIDRLYGMGQEGHPVGEDAFAALRATSDADGRFVIAGVGLGERYALAATAPGFGASEVVDGIRVTREARTTRVTLRLRGACRLRVRCTDSEGRAWPQLRVGIEGEWADATNAYAETDAEGIARFEGVTPGDYYVRAPDEIRGGQALPTVHAVSGDVDFPLALPGTPAEPAGDPFDQPARVPEPPEGVDAPPDSPPTRSSENVTARVRVVEGVVPPKTISERAEYRGGSAGGGRSWLPDAGGDVTIAWTYDVPKFQFIVEADGFLPIVRDVELDALGKADLGSLVLEPGETIAGIVVAPDGKPLADVRVQLAFPANEARSGLERLVDGADAQTQRRFQREVTTLADGTFELRGFPKGPVAVTLRDPRFLPFEQRLDAPTGKSPASLKVRFGGVIRVRAVDTDGLPATRRGVAMYDLAPEAGSGWEGSGTTDVEGLYHLRVKPGTHRIEVRPLRDYDSPDTVRSTVTVEEGETREVRVVVPIR